MRILCNLGSRTHDRERLKTSPSRVIKLLNRFIQANFKKKQGHTRQKAGHLHCCTVERLEMEKK
jgi:hypothetical protein